MKRREEDEKKAVSSYTIHRYYVHIYLNGLYGFWKKSSSDDEYIRNGKCIDIDNTRCQKKK